jgi:hypothetical protein
VKKYLKYVMMFVVLSVVLMTIMPAMIYAPPSILYVDCQNDSDPLENGSQTHPFNTIGEAIDVVTNGWTISVSAGTYNENLSIGLEGETISIVGTGSSKPVIYGGGSGTVISVKNVGGDPVNDILILRNLAITNGVAPNGGGIHSSIYQLEVYDCNIYSNHATSGGGGISSTKDTLIDGCNISNNWAASGVSGGGIEFSNGTLTITDSIISSNSAGGTNTGDPFGQGGGIYFNNGTLNISNCSIYNNITKSSGSGIESNAIQIYSTLNATMNWWGSSTGPYQSSLNAGGQGNSIIGSGLLLSNFYPWLTSDPFAAPASKKTVKAKPVEPVAWVRDHPLTCYQVWINQDNNFEFIFLWEYANNNWVRIYDMQGDEVFSIDMPYGNAHFEASLPAGMYTVKTFHDQAAPLQEFIIGKP